MLSYVFVLKYIWNNKPIKSVEISVTTAVNSKRKRNDSKLISFILFKSPLLFLMETNRGLVRIQTAASNDKLLRISMDTQEVIWMMNYVLWWYESKCWWLFERVFSMLFFHKSFLCSMSTILLKVTTFILKRI